MNGEPPTLVAVFRTRMGRRARERALVLEAVGIPSLIAQEAGEHILAVDVRFAERAGHELREYELENRGWRKPDELPMALSAGWPAVVAWCFALLVFDAAARMGGLGPSWKQAGLNDGALVRAGELWRTVTALTLHADIVHLLGNIVFGALFLVLVAEILGNGLGMLAVVVSGAAGNLVNAAVQGDGFRSLGASTAVFAALGVVGAHRWQRRKRVRSRGAASWAPLLACAFLLGYLGAGSSDGPRSIDVAGHVCGFLAGALTGTVLGRTLGSRPSSTALQVACGSAAFAMVVGAWWLAFAR